MQTATQVCQYKKPIRTEKYLFSGTMLEAFNEINSQQTLSTKFKTIMFAPLFCISEK